MFNMEKTIRIAFDRTKATDKATGYISNINLSSIASTLIQECGRWTDHYASDFLITWRDIQDITDGSVTADPGYDRIFIFAIRANGVDHDTFFASNVTKRLTKFQPYLDISDYRRVYGVRITVGEDGRCTGELKNLTHAFTSLCEDDEDEFFADKD